MRPFYHRRRDLILFNNREIWSCFQLWIINRSKFLSSVSRLSILSAGVVNLQPATLYAGVRSRRCFNFDSMLVGGQLVERAEPRAPSWVDALTTPFDVEDRDRRASLAFVRNWIKTAADSSESRYLPFSETMLGQGCEARRIHWRYSLSPFAGTGEYSIYRINAISTEGTTLCKLKEKICPARLARSKSV